MANYTKIEQERAAVRKMIANWKPTNEWTMPPCSIQGCDGPGPKRFAYGREFYCQTHADELHAQMDAKEEADRQRRAARKKLFDDLRAKRTTG